jgi:hypothetical protein
MTPENPSQPVPDAPKPAMSPVSSTASLTDQLTPMLTDLLYPSESDEPVTSLTMLFDTPEALSVSQLKNTLLIPPGTFVEEVPENWFWDNVTNQDYTDDEAKARNARFAAIKTLLDKSLTNRQVFRVGTVEIDVYLFGQLPDGSRAGLQTKVIET